MDNRFTIPYHNNNGNNPMNMNHTLPSPINVPTVSFPTYYNPSSHNNNSNTHPYQPSTLQQSSLLQQLPPPSFQSAYPSSSNSYPSGPQSTAALVPFQNAGRMTTGPSTTTASEHALKMAQRFGLPLPHPSSSSSSSSSFSSTTVPSRSPYTDTFLVPASLQQHSSSSSSALPVAMYDLSSSSSSSSSSAMNKHGVQPPFIVSTAVHASSSLLSSPSPLRTPNERKDELYASRTQQNLPLFRTIDLSANGAENGGNYLPYDEVKFPSLDKGLLTKSGIHTTGPEHIPAPEPSADLDSMWLLGFLDHENSTTQTNRQRDFKDYEQMFYAKGPETIAEEKRLTKQKLLQSSSSASSDPEESKSTAPSSSSTKQPHQFLSGAEIARLRELQLQFLAEKTKNGPSAVDRLATSAYAKENAKIRKVLSLRGEAGQRKLKRLFKPLPKTMQSTAMDNLLYLERLETQAAIVIQRTYRKYSRICFWRKYLKESKAATTIQRCYRGYRARIAAREYKKRQDMLALKLQASARGKLARDKLAREKEYENRAGEDIQRVWRGHYFRIKAQRRLRKKAAIKIQRLWRGLRGRAKADKLYLDKCATLIQRHVLKWLAQKKYRIALKLETEAAIQVQSAFRGWKIRQRRNNQLFEKESEARKVWMSILKAEEVWLNKEIAALGKYATKQDIDGQIKTLLSEWEAVQATIAEKEFDLVSLQTERVKLSPRAVEQGWSAQLDKDVLEHRNWVTEQKINALFKIALPLRDLRNKKDKLTKRLEDMISDRQRFSERWETDRADLWKRENELTWGKRRYELAKRSADERRKWAVKYYTDTGKVDMARRPGQPLVLEDFPLSDSRTLTIAHGDVMALTKPDTVAMDPAIIEAQQREHKLRLQYTMAQQLLDARARFDGQTAWADPNHVLLDTYNGIVDGQQVLLLPDGTVAVGSGDTAGVPSIASSSSSSNEGNGFPSNDGNPVVRVGPAPSPSFPNVNGGNSMYDANLLPGFVPLGMTVNRTTTANNALPVGSPVSVPRPNDASFSSSLPNHPPSSLASEPSISSSKGPSLEELSLNQQELQRLHPLVDTNLGPQYIGFADSENVIQVRPDLRSSAHANPSGTGKALASIFGIIPEGARGNVMTVGHYFGDEFGYGISGTQEEQTHSVLVQRARQNLKPLHQRVWETSISRYAGVGPTSNDPLSKNRARTEVAGHVEDARQNYANQTESNFAPNERGGIGLDKENTLDSDSYASLSTRRSQPGFDTMDDPAQRKGAPKYIGMIKDKAANAAATDIPDEMKNATALLVQKARDIAAIARLAPGLAGARAGAAASVIASSRAKGTIGQTNVRRTVLDRSELRTQEQETMDRQTTRIQQLTQKIAAVSGQAELLQYGALTKPLMDGMATLQQHLMAADGTAVTLTQAADMRVRKEMERTTKLENVRETMRQARLSGNNTNPFSTNDSSTIPSTNNSRKNSQYGSYGSNNNNNNDRTLSGTMLLNQSIRIDEGDSNDNNNQRLTETYYPPSVFSTANRKNKGGQGANTMMNNTQLSLMETLPPQTNGNSGGSGSIASNTNNRGGLLSKAEQDILIANQKALELEQSVARLKKTQSRVRAQMAVQDANAALQRAGDIWSEAQGNPATTNTVRTNPHPNPRTNWSLQDEVEAERLRMTMQAEKPLPFATAVPAHKATTGTTTTTKPVTNGKKGTTGSTTATVTGKPPTGKRK